MQGLLSLPNEKQVTVGMDYSIDSISSIVQGKIYGNSSLPLVIRYLCTDSRKVSHPVNSLFIAIEGKYKNGHTFIAQAYRQGIRCFLVHEKTEFEKYTDSVFIQVVDTLEALQSLAAHHRHQFSYPVIGITGSNGKTIVKEWLYQLLVPYYRVVKNPGSYNSQLGVPLSVWNLKADADVGIFEAGISQPGEMNNLEKVIHPTIGIFTMIGDAHGENFSSVQEKIREKIQLFHSAHELIYCKDHNLIHHEISTSEALKDMRFFTWSQKENSDLRIIRKEKKEGCWEVDLMHHSAFHVTIPFSDDASFENAMHCISLMLVMKISIAQIQSGIQQMNSVSMRLQIKKGIHGCTIINDTYNADLDSVRIAYHTMNELGNHLPKTLILSDIEQSSKNNEELYGELAKWTNTSAFHRVFLIGAQLKKYASLFQHVETVFDSTDDMLSRVFEITFQNENILLKGSRQFQLEKIAVQLEEKLHSTILEINLSALAHNLNYYKSKLAPGTKMMAMVKASSYGSGDIEVPRLLEFYHTDYLAVAYADEGIFLRNAGINLPIMVMSPDDLHYDVMAMHRLEPEIYNIRTLHHFIQFIHTSPKYIPPVHIKLDTGMHRLGFVENEIDHLIGLLLQHPQIKIASVFSHLSASDADEHRTFTETQISVFQQMAEKISFAVGYQPLRHILNSAGIAHYPESQFEMVRLGIGLYGATNVADETKQLLPVAKLITRISQIKKISAGESVGYSRSTICSADTTIATIPIGYADGFRRLLSNGKGHVLVNGHKAPVIGKVCMDMTMIDITGIDAAEGDEVIIFGDEALTLEEFSIQCETIPYEVLTSISQRVKRVYVKE